MDIPITSAERLLAAMHPTCSHDLPNQILSLQSLIHLMEMDEVEQLGPAGREYVQRLKAVAEKAAGMSDFLKAIVRLVRYVPQPREIALADLFRQLKAEARSVLQSPLTWEVRLLAGGVWADYDLVSSALSELLRALADGVAPTIAKTVSIASSVRSLRTIVDIAVRGPGVHTRLTMLPQRADYLLARERLHAAGVDLRLGPARVDEASVALEFAAERL